MAWQEWFGWPFQLSLCFGALVSLGYVAWSFNRSRIHPWYMLVIIEVSGLVWCLYWLGWSISEHRWISVAFYPLIIAFLLHNARDSWRQRETRHLPYREDADDLTPE